MAMYGVLLSLADQKSREEFKSPIGKRASALRRSLISDVLDLARARAYPRETLDPSEVVLDEMPFWLEKHEGEDYITSKHIRRGQDQFETKTSNTPPYHRPVAVGKGAEPDRDEHHRHSVQAHEREFPKEATPCLRRLCGVRRVPFPQLGQVP